MRIVKVMIKDLALGTIRVMVGTITTEGDKTIRTIKTLRKMKTNKGMVIRGPGSARNVRKVIRAICAKANQLNVILVAKLDIRLIIVPRGKRETNQGRMDTTKAITVGPLEF